ncbi:MAG: hypothetical protein WAN44_20355 [Propionibacteriaceae bacterium]
MYHVIDGVVSLLTNSGWRHNFTGGKDIEVTFRGRRQGARAVLIDDADTVAAVYERLIGELGPSRAKRRLGSASTWIAHPLLASCATRSSDQASQSSRFTTEQTTDFTGRGSR